MARQFHWKLHYRPSKYERPGESMGEFRTRCDCTRFHGRDHNCATNCKVPGCEQRKDGKKPTTVDDEMRADLQLELDRHIPPRQPGHYGNNAEAGYYCKSWCGARVENQLQHFNYHTNPHPDWTMRVVLTALFGDDDATS